MELLRNCVEMYFLKRALLFALRQFSFARKFCLRYLRNIST
jgi:hypothetical protein